ncbi:YhcN/YlaJ family sporulation lipoprotein [Neobacillus sp. SuZ13]|uniref:YhcN/YlaJ family sporulation lipoprotein n=1 Tax=Neobacillus sp. SuZ13 TaxID=3047875 RepID=UPI0024C06755|nr:YhcN/YlaJ family sporulation lipoprotein [Neobacillus sp. SuZ13]WHY69362.1 YhcN/YlaJ family sporulation lipoprotein [Neobacillus sp. SuZ13]
MVRKSWMTFVLATTLLGLTGCANDNDNAVNNNSNDLGVNNVRNNAINGVNVRNVSNQNLRVSARAIRNVESLNEVDQANVIIRNNDAYVAVRLEGTQNGARARGGTTGTGPNMNATYGNGYNSGTTGTNGSANLHATTGNRNNATITGTTGTRTNARINRANDLNARGNNTLDQKIINQVRAADRSIDNVYISYDTDTFGQMTNYSNDIRTGTNRDGLWNDFTNSVNRMFR